MLTRLQNTLSPEQLERYTRPKRPGSDGADARARRQEIEDRRESDRVQGIAEREREQARERLAERERQRQAMAKHQQQLAAEHETLRSNLANAQAALDSVGGVDLSSEEAAIASLDNAARRLAGEAIVDRATKALEYRERDRLRR